MALMQNMHASLRIGALFSIRTLPQRFVCSF